jgi:hypothetical protein
MILEEHTPRRLTSEMHEGMVAGMAEEIKAGPYRHYKGKDYIVYFVVTHSETMEEMVLYQAAYGAGGMWVKPLVMFNEEVEVDG